MSTKTAERGDGSAEDFVFGERSKRFRQRAAELASFLGMHTKDARSAIGRIIETPDGSPSRHLAHLKPGERIVSDGLQKDLPQEELKDFQRYVDYSFLVYLECAEDGGPDTVKSIEITPECPPYRVIKALLDEGIKL